MNNSINLSHEQFKELLYQIYLKGESEEKIRSMDLISEIKKRILAIVEI